jgi:ABC-type phosphate transport system substrate-binding protein
MLGIGHAQAGVVVIGHEKLGKLDAKTMQKIYTGKVVEVRGIRVTPVNLPPCELRDRFLQDILKSDDEKYTAYWTVRRYIGKGIPPMEIDKPEDVVEFVRSTPGAIGYIDENELTADLNVISR